MARKEQVTCDVCGAQKQETNHWFMLSVGDQDIFVLASSSYRDNYAEPIDLCGEACVLKKVSELISKQ